jgi:hypothetical protein
LLIVKREYLSVVVTDPRIRRRGYRMTRLSKETKSVEGDVPEDLFFFRKQSLKGQDGVIFKRVLATFGVS